MRRGRAARAFCAKRRWRSCARAPPPSRRSIVSPSWREELLIGLAPGGVQIARQLAAPWREAIGQLGRARPRGSCRIVLSNHFLRYALLPWDAGLAGQA